MRTTGVTVVIASRPGLYMYVWLLPFWAVRSTYEYDFVASLHLRNRAAGPQTPRRATTGDCQLQARLIVQEKNH